MEGWIILGLISFLLFVAHAVPSVVTVVENWKDGSLKVRLVDILRALFVSECLSNYL